MRKEIAKEILIGYLVTIACNLAGMYFYVSTVNAFAEMGTLEALRKSIEIDVFSSVVALGAILDFLAFFVFLKKGQFYRVRGVLLGVLTAAVVVVLFRFIL